MNGIQSIEKSAYRKRRIDGQSYRSGYNGREKLDRWIR